MKLAGYSTPREEIKKAPAVTPGEPLVAWGWSSYPLLRSNVWGYARCHLVTKDGSLLVGSFHVEVSAGYSSLSAHGIPDIVLLRGEELDQKH